MLRFPWLSVALFTLAAGCAQPVRQDRTIAVSPDGKHVAISHDADGVFIGDPQTGAVHKIYEPGADVLATSSPLWAADGKRLIFTVAKTLDGRPAPHTTTPADGRRFGAQPAIYSCMLMEDAMNRAAKPVELFMAPCDHVGYVGANLAVRWHPDGQAIDFIQRTSPGKHGLFRFDLRTKTSTRLLQVEADALVFDFIPGSSRHFCLLGTNQVRGPSDGLWIERAAGDWWLVPDSRVSTSDMAPSILEPLREARPVFSRDGRRAAFVSYAPGPKDQEGTFTLRAADIPSQTLADCHRSEQRLRDICWHPDGSRVGFIEGRDSGKLLLVGMDRQPAKVLDARRTVSFAGWDAAGERLAFVVQDDLPYQEGAGYSMLLLPNANARTSIVVAESEAKEPGKVLVSGLRATFLKWFPNEPKLTVWLTFEPTYRRWSSAIAAGQAGLLPGDPAASLDVRTGKWEWLTVNSFEQVQVGHHRLWLRDLDETARLYQQHGENLSPRDRRELLVFEWLLHKRQGDELGAKRMLDAYRRQTVPVIDVRGIPLLPSPMPALGLLGGAGVDAAVAQQFPSILERDLLIAEVCLSMDALEEAVNFFCESVKNETGDQRLSSAVILSQLRFLQRDFAAYHDLVFEQIIPAYGRSESQSYRSMMLMLAMRPMTMPDYLAAVPLATRQGLVERWQTVRQAQTSERLNQTASRALYFLAVGLKDETLREKSARDLGIDTPEKREQFEKGANQPFAGI